MRSATGTRFSIIPEGEFKEEVWEWSDIETMSRDGRLSPDSLIFLPEENAWTKLGDTDLAACFERPARAETRGGPPPADPACGDEEPLLEQIRSNPNDVALRLKAADVALAAGKADAACDHFQRALDANPYHPRVAQEAKRKLPASKWKSLRYLEKPPHVWEDPVAVFAYPFSRGPLYFALPALALTLLFRAGWTTALALVAVSLWVMETVRAASQGESRPPLWHGLVADPLRRVLKPVAVTVVVAAELSALFVAIAGVLIVTRASGETGLLLVIGKSPVLTVLLCTSFLSYFPAAAMLSGASRCGILRIANPKTIVAAVRMMEGEYLISVFIVAVLLCATWGIGALIGSVPVLGPAFQAAATVYILLFAGFVLGKLYARFGERIDAQARAAGSGAE